MCYLFFCLECGSGMAQCLAPHSMDRWVPGSRPGRVAVHCGLEQVTFAHCLVLVKPRKPWTYIGLTWTYCDEAGDYVVPNELCRRDLVSRPDNMNETVLWSVDCPY